MKRAADFRKFPAERAATAMRSPPLAVNSEQLVKIEALFQQLDIVQSPQDLENRRHAPRLNVRVSLTAILLSALNPSPVPIFSRNISISGIGFVSRRLFKSHERIAIKIEIADLPPRLLLAEVTFSRYVSGGLYEMGAEFLECVRGRSASRIPTHWMLNAGASRVTKPAPSTKHPDEPAPKETPASH
jgi:hypothetical protein